MSFTPTEEDTLKIFSRPRPTVQQQLSSLDALTASLISSTATQLSR